MKLNKYIDHTLLKQDATEEQIDRLLSEAKDFDFASVCVNPCWVSHAKTALVDTDVKVCTVVGFPLGATTSAVKAYETKEAIQMVLTKLIWLSMLVHSNQEMLH